MVKRYNLLFTDVELKGFFFTRLENADMFPQKGAMHRVVTAHVRHNQIRLTKRL